MPFRKLSAGKNEFYLDAGMFEAFVVGSATLEVCQNGKTFFFQNVFNVFSIKVNLSCHFSTVLLHVLCMSAFQPLRFCF